MTLSQGLLLIHLLGVVMWLGGATLLVVFGRRTLSRGAADGTRDFLKDSGFAGNIFGVVSTLVLTTGIWLVLEVDRWTFGQTWVWLSLVLAGALYLMGPGYHAPKAKRRFRIAEEKGGNHPDVVAGVREWLQVSVVEIVVGLFIVWLMVVNPWL
jgi:uncharacterized membrane protein